MDFLVRLLGYAALFALSGVVLRVLATILRAPIDIPRAARANADLQTFETLKGFSPSFSMVSQRRQGIAVDLQTGTLALLVGDANRYTPKVFPHSALCQCTASFTGNIRLTLQDSHLKNYEMAEANADAVNCVQMLLQTFIGTSYHSTRDHKYKPSYLQAIEDVRGMEQDPKNERCAQLKAMLAFIESSPFAEGEYLIAHYDFVHVLTNRGLWSVSEPAHNITNIRWPDIASVSAVRADDIVADVVLTLGSGEQQTLPGWLHGAARAVGLIAMHWKDGGEFRQVASPPTPRGPQPTSSGGVQRCLQCGTRVLPLADGSCPACRTPMP